MPLRIVRDDITLQRVDAIVNAANEWLRRGGGVCGAIFEAAGASELQDACNQIGHVDTGSAVATPGFTLPARHIIHTAGPRWRGTADDRRLLASCYASSLALARDLGDRSIAFPLISSGIYGCPKDQALAIATGAIRSFLEGDDTDMEVTLVLFDRGATILGEELYGRLSRFVDDTYVGEREERFGRHRNLSLEPWLADLAMSLAPDVRPLADEPADDLEERLRTLDASFPETLLSLIDERGLTDAQVYKRANLSRQYFSKLRGGTINPGKRVVLALAVALELDLAQTRLLLERSGYALSRSNMLDVIVEFFIEHGTYDVFAINEALFSYDLPLLGT